MHFVRIIFEFQIKCNWNIFLVALLTRGQCWFLQWLYAKQATSHYRNQRWSNLLTHLYASLGLMRITHVKLQTPFVQKQSIFLLSLHWHCIVWYGGHLLVNIFMVVLFQLMYHKMWNETGVYNDNISFLCDCKVGHDLSDHMCPRYNNTCRNRGIGMISVIKTHTCTIYKGQSPFHGTFHFWRIDEYQCVLNFVDNIQYILRFFFATQQHRVCNLIIFRLSKASLESVRKSRKHITVYRFCAIYTLKNSDFKRPVDSMQFKQQWHILKQENWYFLSWSPEMQLL